MSLSEKRVRRIAAEMIADALRLRDDRREIRTLDHELSATRGQVSKLSRELSGLRTSTSDEVRDA